MKRDEWWNSWLRSIIRLRAARHFDDDDYDIRMTTFTAFSFGFYNNDIAYSGLLDYSTAAEARTLILFDLSKSTCTDTVITCVASNGKWFSFQCWFVTRYLILLLQVC